MTQRRISGDFFSACERGDLAEMQRLFDLGADINYPDPAANHQQPLHAAVGSPNNQQTLTVATWLLDRGAHVNAGGRNGLPTPLILAIKFCRLEMLSLLLERGANPDLKVGGAQLPFAISPMCMVVSSCMSWASGARGNFTIAKEMLGLLMRKGAKIDLEIDHGNNPVAMASVMEDQSLLAFLLEQKPSESTLAPAIWQARISTVLPISERGKVIRMLRDAQASLIPPEDMNGSSMSRGDMSGFTESVRLGYEAIDVSNRGTELWRRGDLAGAEAMHKQALAMKLRAHKESSKEVAISYSIFSGIYRDWGNKEPAGSQSQKEKFNLALDFAQKCLANWLNFDYCQLLSRNMAIKEEEQTRTGQGSSISFTPLTIRHQLWEGRKKRLWEGDAIAGVQGMQECLLMQHSLPESALEISQRYLQIGSIRLFDSSLIDPEFEL